jgi:hypothetical protein
MTSLRLTDDRMLRPTSADPTVTNVQEAFGLRRPNLRPPAGRSDAVAQIRPIPLAKPYVAAPDRADVFPFGKKSSLPILGMKRSRRWESRPATNEKAPIVPYERNLSRRLPH